MGIGAAFLIAAVYAAYSGCFYVINWLFAHGHPKVAAAAAVSALLVNWAAAAVVTSGHSGREGNLLWLLFGAAIPFLGGLALASFGDGGPNRSTGIALMVGTIVPVLMFIYIAWGHVRAGSLRWPSSKQ